MAFTASGLVQVGGGVGSGPKVFVYTSADARATVEGANYFTNYAKYGLKVGDVVIVIYTTGYVVTIHSIASVSGTSATINAAVLA